MRDFDDCLAYEALAMALEISDLPLIDRMVLSTEYERSNIAFSVDDHQLLQTWDFFEARQYEFYFVQNGEFLTLEHLDKNKLFIAYEKERSGFNCSTQKDLHCIYAYKPET